MREVSLIEIGCDRSELNEPIGLCTVAAAVAEKHRIDDRLVKLFWQKIPSRRATPEKLRNSKLIGISAQINSLKQTRELYWTIRAADPFVPIVIGNLLAIYAGEQLLSEFPDAILCTGEGENTFSELYRLVSGDHSVRLDRNDLRVIPNLMFMDQGKLVKTASRLVHVAELPLPRREFTADLVALGGITRVEASRGCHWGRCEFCSVSSRFGLGGYRRFVPTRVVDDLEALAAAGALSPYFSDEDFFGGKYEESRELANLIIDAKVEGRIPKDMNFFISVLASDVKHPEGRAALAHWKSAGLREVFVGIEAGAEDEIRRFAKKSNAGTNTTAVNTLQAMGFQVDIGFIMFDPMMTFGDLSENVDWLRRQRLENVDSRVTKGLRIQPQTGFEVQYGSLITGPMNVDELTYPSTFSDEKVARVERRFRSWEIELKSDVYTMLGEGRGEVKSEEHRLDRKRMLASIRDIDIAYLQCLIDLERGGTSTEELNRAQSELAERKRRLLVATRAPSLISYANAS
jgi:radical SAM superfamily enzyme YgiQ (UPF0313 family)